MKRDFVHQRAIPLITTSPSCCLIPSSFQAAAFLPQIGPWCCPPTVYQHPARRTQNTLRCLRRALLAARSEQLQMLHFTVHRKTSKNTGKDLWHFPLMREMP
jgi:hypothetical protein